MHSQPRVIRIHLIELLLLPYILRNLYDEEIKESSMFINGKPQYCFWEHGANWAKRTHTHTYRA